MSKEIIKPDGGELMRYLNKGYAICNKCGAVMDKTADPEGGCDIYVCPSCGWEVDETDYEYEHEDERVYITDSYYVLKRNEPPAGCKACGGPYPYCKSTCKEFDD